MPIFFSFKRLSFKLAFGICTALIIIVAIFFYQQYHLHKSRLINGLKTSLTAQGILIEKGLKFSMLEGHSTIVQEMMEELSKSNDVERVWILNKNGIVKASSERALLGKRLNVEDPTCQICHQKALENRSKTVIFKAKGGKKVFRNVVTINNQEKCFACHNPGSKANGVLIIDYSLLGITQQLSSDLWKMGKLALLMLVAIALVIIFLANRLVLGKIKVLEKASKNVQRGDLDQRVKIKGEDEISYLAYHFNLMTSSLRDSMEHTEHQKRYLENLINSINDSVVVIDREYRIVMANHSYVSRLSNESQDVIGRSCFSISHKFLIHCDDVSFDCPAKRTFELASMSKTIHCFEHEDGKKEFWEIYASPVRDERGRVIQVVEVMRDITERKLLEEKLSHSERLASLGVMALGISHEINNPLASITTCLDGLERRVKKNKAFGNDGLKDFTEYIELIQKEIARCKEITGKLLTLSEKPKANLDSFEIHKALRETISLLKEEAETRKITVSTDLGPQKKTIFADDGQIRQVFLNIILNAMEAIGENGRIHISTHLEDERVIAIFEDTGKGIKEGDLKKVFEPFYTKTEGRRGTGLGLTICESIIRQHKGDISIHSKNGKGTKVTIQLPLNPNPDKPEIRSTNSEIRNKS